MGNVFLIRIVIMLFVSHLCMFGMSTVPALRGKDYGKTKMKYPDYTETESGLQYKVAKLAIHCLLPFQNSLSFFLLQNVFHFQSFGCKFFYFFSKMYVSQNIGMYAGFATRRWPRPEDGRHSCGIAQPSALPFPICVFSCFVFYHFL